MRFVFGFLRTQRTEGALGEVAVEGALRAEILQILFKLTHSLQSPDKKVVQSCAGCFYTSSEGVEVISAHLRRAGVWVFGGTHSAEQTFGLLRTMC